MSRIKNLFRSMGRKTKRRPFRTSTFHCEQLESRLAPSVNVLSYDYGNTGTTGTNTNETTLTPANVNVNTFGKLYQTPVDGQVYAEPLVDQNVLIGAASGDSAVNVVGPTGTHNVVFVATEHDSLYAIDSASGTILWQRSFTNITSSYIGSVPGTNVNNTLGATAIGTVPATETGSTNINPEIGITGTPVIDPNSGSLYVLVKTKETIGGNVHYVQHLHGINLSDGTDKIAPFMVGDTTGGNSNNTQIFVYGTGDGNVNDPNHTTDGNPGTTIVQFNALHEAQRPGLTFENGQVYIAFASHGDNGPYHGWVIAWKPTSSGFQLAGWFNSSPNNGLSGIWAGGGGVQFEPDGSAFYFETGNGSGGNPTLNAQGFPTNANYNEALVKVGADATTSINHQGPNGWGMKAVDYFIPYNVAALDAADADFGSGAPLLLPPSASLPGHPNLMVAAGKSGEIYLVDRNNLGKWNAVNDNVLNDINDGSGHLHPPNMVSGSLSTPAYYNGKLYWVSGYSGSAFSYTITPNMPASPGKLTVASQSSIQFGYAPGSIQVSANGTLNGITWVMDRNLNEIHAYDASTFATELWNSNKRAGGGDRLPSVTLFAPPTVANGQVFVGTLNSLMAYGLNQAANAPSNPPALAAAPVSGSSINLTWTDNSVSPNTATSYSIEESTDNITFSVVGTAPAGATSIGIGGLSPSTLYDFRIRGHNDVGYSTYSNVATATTTAVVPGLDFSGGFGSSGSQSQFTLNSSAHFAGSNLELTTSGNQNQTASAFVTAPIDITSFQTQFTFQSTSGAATAEGFTFTLQNVSAAALGAPGAALGYGPQSGGGNAGIANSVAIKFDLNNNNGEGNDSTGLYINGAAPTNANSIDLTSTGINLHSGDVFQVNMNYNGTTLTVTIKDTVTSAMVTENYPIAIASTIGNTTAYVGFTGSTGSQTATQDILTWTYNPTAATSPNAPSGLGASAASATSIALTWTTNSTNQTSFNLDRATDMAFTQNLITENLPATPSSFIDTATGLGPGQTFYYRLRAFNSAGNSGYSNFASATIPVAPATPTGAFVLSVSSSEIDLQWQDNAGHDCQGYHVFRATNHGSFVLVANLPPTSRTAPDPYGFIDTAVTSGTFYDYHIVCYNVSGNNDFAGVNVTTLTTPPNLVYSQLSSSAATLYFTSPTGATSYNIYRGTTSGGESLLAAHVSGSPYTDSTIVTGTTYYYYVTAINANVAPVANESIPSNEISPRPGGGTFQWTGGGSDANWNTAGNWMGGAVPTGNGNESLIFPAGASQQTNTDNLPAGSNAFNTILFSGAGYDITVSSPLAVGSGGISMQVAGTNTFDGASGPGLFLVANEAFTTVSGSILNVNTPLDNDGFTLTMNEAGNTKLTGVLSDSGGLTVSGTGTLTLSGANTYSGATLINSGATVSALNGSALGINSAATINGTLNAVTVAGLPGTYYNTTGASDPLSAIGAPANASPANLLAYAATLPVIGTDNSANAPQPGPSNWNHNGAYFDYGEDGNATTVGFPTAVQNSNGGTFILGIWSGQFYAPVTGVYDFGTSSDDGSAIYVDGSLVVDNNAYQGMTFRDSNSPLDPGATTAPTLAGGTHTILIGYYNGGGTPNSDPYGLYANVSGPVGSGLSGHLLNSSLSPGFIGTIQLGSLTGTGTINLGTTALTVGSNNTSTTFGGHITGSGIVTKTGSGDFLLSANQTYTGPTVINGGTLQLGDGTHPVSSEATPTITNNTTNPLVIANPSGNTFTLAANISGAAGVTVMGSGLVTLGGQSTYTGPTVIPTGSTVSAALGALGTGTATLNGGTLDLVAPPSLTGFGGNGTGWKQNGGGGSFLAPDVYQITPNAGNQANSIFYLTKVQPTAGFTTSFTYTDTTASTGGADGVAFVLQNAAAGASTVGGAGGGLGYAGVTPSIAIELNIYHPNGVGVIEHINGATGGYTNPGGPFGTLDSGDPINITVTYNSVAQTVTVTGTDAVTAASASITYTGINLASILGGTSAYVGFTGGTGGAQSAQVISNFSYLQATALATSASFPNNFQAGSGTSTLALNVSSGANAYSISGNVTVPATATLNVTADAASTTNQAYSLTISGNTTVGGTLNVANNGTTVASLILKGAVSGTTALGGSMGTIGGSASLTLSSTSTYNVVLGGNSSGQYDNLAVNGAATLAGGKLNLSYANTFSPSVGQTFTILHTGGNLTGTFAQGSTITVGNATYSIAYNTKSVVLTVTAVAAVTKLVLSAPSTATAGTSFSVTVTAEDAGGHTAGGFTGSVTLSSTAGADISPTSVTLTNGTATFSVTLTGAGTQTIMAAYTGLTSGTASIIVSPGPFVKYLVTTMFAGPTVTAGNSFVVDVQAADALGNPIASGYSGPASVTASISPTSTGSNFPFTITIGSNGQGFAVATLDAVGVYTISVADSTHTFTGSAPPLTVNPAVAAKLSFGTQPVTTPTGVTLPPATVQVQDTFGNVVTSDNSDVVTLSIASGPGSFTVGSTTTVTVVNGVATFNNLTLVVPGSYTLAETVTATYVGPNSSSFNVTPLQVVPGSFTSSPSGFSLSLNAPFLVNSTTPVLFGTGFGATAPAPTVTLMGPSGPVEGSLVVNTVTNSLTFVETNTASVVNNGTPILPDGTYTVDVLSSGATGIQALNSGGGYLDGNGTGVAGSGDYTATFTVNAAAAHEDVVWVPATADGPKQFLNAPGGNQIGAGYPVYLNDSTETVTSVTVTINYNPVMLTVNGASSNSALSGSSFTLNTGLSSPGHAVLTYMDSGANSSHLTGGQVALGFLQAAVPNSSAATPIYKGKDLLHLSGVSINGGAIPSVGGDALHLVAYVGDGDGNGSYSSNDAVLITRATLQTDTGFTAYPLVDPVIVADTDGAGFIPADSALQANEAGIGFPTPNLFVPPVPAGANTTPIGNNVDPTVSLPRSLQVDANGTVRVPVNIDDAHPAGSTGLIAGHLALTYNPHLFTVSPGDVHAGSVLAAGDWSVIPTIDPVTGEIGIALSSSTPIHSAVGGSLVTIDFHQTGGGAGSAAIALVASVSPNGQLVTTELEDAQGTFTLTPALSNGVDPHVESIVMVLAPPAAAVVHTLVAEVTRIAITEPLVPATTDAPTGETAGIEPVTSGPVATGSAVSEPRSSDGVVTEVSTAPVRETHAAVVAAISSFATAPVGTLTGVPLTSLVFQVASAQGWVGIAAGQHATDPLFQAWISSPGDPQVGIEHVLANPLLRVPLAVDYLDNVNWDEFGGEWDWHSVGDAAGVESRGRTDGTVLSGTSPARVQVPLTDRAAMDRYFAEANDTPDQVMDDE